MPSDLPSRFEVDQVEGLADDDVIACREVEDARLADLTELSALVFGQADRGVGMRQIGDASQQ